MSARQAPVEVPAEIDGVPTAGLSKSQLKKLMKQAQNNKKKEAKAAAKEAKAAAEGTKLAKPKVAQDDEADLNPSQYLEIRQAMIRQFEKEGGDAYPHKFQCSMSIPHYVQTYASLSDGVKIMEMLQAPLLLFAQQHMRSASHR